MNDEILSKLNDEIERLIERLGTLQPGSNEYGAVTKDLTDLEDRRAKELANIKDLKELEMKELKLNDETLQKQQEIDEAKKNRWIDRGLDAAKFVIMGLGFVAFQIAGYAFEEKGSLTSTTFKETRQKMTKNVFRK